MHLLTIMKQVTDAKLDRYFKVTGTALKKAKLSKNLSEKEKKLALQFRDFCQRYFEDAKYFREKGDYVTAFAALNYAHAWLDAGAIQGLFDVKGQDKLFSVD